MLSSEKILPPTVSCFFVQNRLGDLLDQRCPEWMLQPIQTHLQSCKSCKILHAELQTIIHVLEHMPRQTLKQDLTSRTKTVKNRHRTLVVPRAVWVSLEGLAGIAVVAGLIFSMPRLKPQLSSWLSKASWNFERKAKVNLVEFKPEIEPELVEALFFEKLVTDSRIQRRWDPSAKPKTVIQKVPKPTHVDESDDAPMEDYAQAETPEPIQPIAPLQATAQQPTHEVTQKLNYEFISITMILTENQKTAHDKVMALLAPFNIEKAGKSEFGEIFNGGLYYHFLVNNESASQLKNKLKALGSLSERKRDSTTGVPEGKARIALWIGAKAP